MGKGGTGQTVKRVAPPHAAKSEPRINVDIQGCAWCTKRGTTVFQGKWACEAHERELQLEAIEVTSVPASKRLIQGE